SKGNGRLHLLEELFKPLAADAREAMDAATVPGASGYQKRTAFRTVFAAIEALIFLHKDWVLSGRRSEGCSAAELSLLREESYRLDHRGEVEEVQSFLRVPENLLFTWRMMCGKPLPDLK